MTTDVSHLRWDTVKGDEGIEEYEYDGGNSSSRLFERSRIKALAGKFRSFRSFFFLVLETLFEKSEMAAAAIAAKWNMFRLEESDRRECKD